jgi:hypothetical protein
MAHPFRYLSSLLLGLIALTVRANAQVGGTDLAQAVRFTVFSARPLTDVAFVPRRGVGAQKAVFYPTARSPRYEYRGTSPLRFLDSESGAVIAEAVIPPEIRDAFLLFTPIPLDSSVGGSGLRYQIAVLDDSAGRHRAGDIVIINFSGLPLGGTVGTQAVTLRPGLNPALTIGRSAKITLRTLWQNRSYQSYAHTLALARTERALLILFPPFYKGSLEVQPRVLIDTPSAARE